MAEISEWSDLMSDDVEEEIEENEESKVVQYDDIGLFHSDIIETINNYE